MVKSMKGLNDNDEKIKRAFMVFAICSLSIPIALFIAFFFAVDKVYAVTTSEIPFTQLTVPVEVKYGYYDSGTLRTTDMTVNYVESNYEGIERFTYYTGQTNSSSKVLTLWLQNALAEDSYYSLTIYYKYTGSGSQAPWDDYYRPCIGTYAQCAMNTENMAPYRSQVLFVANINNPMYITRPNSGSAQYDYLMWSKIQVYTQQWIFKTNSSGNFLTLFFDQNNTGTFAFYGYTIENAGNNPVGVLNSISQTQTMITQQTTSINNTTVQQNQQTQQTVEDEAQATRDTITDSNTSFTDPSINTNTGPISGLLSMPITLAQSINNNTSTCSPFTLGTLYGHTLTMPCINLSNILGSTLYNIIDVICCGIFIYSLRKVLVNVYVKIMSLRNINPGEVS